MANMQYKDRTIEMKLDDGTTAYTKVSIVLNALNFYRNKCLEIIRNGGTTETKRNRITRITSFEDILKYLNDIDDNKESEYVVRKAQELLSEIDSIMRKIINANQPTPPPSGNGFQK